MNLERDTTFVLTSCARFDLLAETMLTFCERNTAPIARYLVVEDSGDASVRNVLGALPVAIEFLVNDPPLGQMASIDRAYAAVGTPYVFHCEDDWRFLRGGFVENRARCSTRATTCRSSWRGGWARTRRTTRSSRPRRSSGWAASTRASPRSTRIRCGAATRSTGAAPPRRLAAPRRLRVDAPRERDQRVVQGARHALRVPRVARLRDDRTAPPRAQRAHAAQPRAPVAGTLNAKDTMDDATIRKLSRKLSRPHRIERGGKFRLKDHDPRSTGELGDGDKAGAEAMLEEGKAALARMQEMLYAQDAGRCWCVPGDGCRRQGRRDQARDVGRQPAGLPGALVQGALARGARPRLPVALRVRLPERGRIGIFNRSYYEEVLVVKVHPSSSSRSGCRTARRQALWDERYEDIRAFGALPRPQRHRSSSSSCTSRRGAEAPLPRAHRERHRTGSSRPPTCASARTGTRTWTPTSG
jgi:hypothetical protein